MAEPMIVATPTNTPVDSRPAFALDAPTFDVPFTIRWPCPEGRINVMHRLRRPTRNEEQKYKRQTSEYTERVNPGGRITDEPGGGSKAIYDFWNALAVVVSGYPPLNGGKETEVTDQVRETMRPTHKELAILNLLECSVDVLFNESEAGLAGGQWAVRLKLGQAEEPYAVLKLWLAEWDERLKAGFEKAAPISSSELEGKARRITSALNLSAYLTLFNNLLLDVRADEEGPHGSVTVGGKDFATAGKEAFAEALLGEWRATIITTLIAVWRGK